VQAADFTASSPGRLVPTIAGALAFVPDPVPRLLEIDLPTAGLLAKAASALGRLTGATPRLMNPFLVGSPLLHREAIISSRIEGTITTPEELVLLEAAGPPRASASPGDEDTREVRNYIAAMQHGLQRLAELPVCLRLVREIHAELLRGVRGERERPGEFRDTQNWIGTRGDSIEAARYVPPPVAEMHTALNDLEQYLNLDTDLPLLVKIALVHYQFEAIHPFRDGNGRIGRLIVPLLLCHHGDMREPLLYLSAFFERCKEQYSDLLLRVSQKGDWLAWVRFFLRGVQESADEAIKQVEGLVALRERWHRQFQRARGTALLQKLIDHLFSVPAITIGDAAKVLEITPAAAAHNVRKLVGAGILNELTGRKRGQVFVAGEILAFLR
jgi:Fic family protein